MDRMTKLRVWDALRNPPGFIGPIHLETAISLGVAGTHTSSGDWFIEFSTGEMDNNADEIFEGDIVTMPGWAKQNYVVRFGRKWLPFADSRDYVDDIGGTTLGFYLEPVPRGTKSKGDEHDRPFAGDECEVVGNIHENPELLEVEK